MSEWITKYKPQTLKEIVGNTEAIKNLTSWTKQTRRKTLLVYGPPGTGKTVAAEALAYDFDLELVKMNANEIQSEEEFTQRASQMGSLYGKTKLVLIEEIDNATDENLQIVINAAKKTGQPMIITADNAYDPRLMMLRKNAVLVEFTKATSIETFKLLQHICTREKIVADDGALRALASKANGDLRSAVKNLQVVAQGKKKLFLKNIQWITFKDANANIFAVLEQIFYGKYDLSINVIDPDTLLEWIYENLPGHFNDHRDLVAALNAVAMADLFRGRMQRTHDLTFESYVLEYLTTGVHSARRYSKTATAPYKFPIRVQMKTRYKLERETRETISHSIGEKMHISTARAQKMVYPYLKFFSQEKVVKWLGLDAETAQFINC